MSDLDPFALGGKLTTSWCEAAPTATFDFVAAELEMEALCDLSEEFSDAGDDSDETNKPIFARWGMIEATICREAPANLVDAVVKLRVLAEPGAGMESSVYEGYNASLAQVLAFLDDLLRRPGSNAHEYVVRWISELQELSRSTGARAEATGDELRYLRQLLWWAESRARRSMPNWPENSGSAGREARLRRAGRGHMTRALIFSARWLAATALLKIAGCVTRLARMVAPRA